MNFRNFKILMSQHKQAPILQNLFNRPEFLLCNVLLHTFFRRKIILFIHEIYEIDHLPLIHKWSLFLVNCIYFWSTSLIVTNSVFTAKWVCRFGNFRRKLFLMYPVVEPLARNLRRRGKPPKGPIRILCVGNIRRKKGQIYLLQAMNYIRHDVEIVFVGLVKEMDYMDRLQEYILTKGIANKVRFTGFLTGQALSEEYEKADIFVSNAERGIRPDCFRGHGVRLAGCGQRYRRHLGTG